MFTNNEKKLLRTLSSLPKTDYSINQLSKECEISPNGTYKILKKFENESILKPKLIANIKSYKINFENEKTNSFLQLIFTDELTGRVKNRYDDLKPLKEIVKVCIIFGSYATNKEKPGDLDLFIILEKENLKEYKEKINKTKELIPSKVHDVLQTPADFIENYSKEERIIKEIITSGVILFGQKELIELIHNGYKN